MDTPLQHPQVASADGLVEAVPPVFFVGLRFGHHARASGYEAFGRYVGTQLPAPVSFRWTQGRVGWPLSKAFARVTRHPWYSIGANVVEWHALTHMLRRRGAVYHLLYGDSDLWLLRRANRVTGNFVVASFHQPPSELEPLRSIPRVARHLDAALLVSESQRPYFERFLPRERVFVVPHGVDSGYFRPPPAGARAAPVCVTVGSHLRDFATLREAILRIWMQRPDMRFVAVGTRSDRKSWFPPLDDPRIEFLDRVGDDVLLRAYQRARLAMFSFRDATANNAMLEAMAAGLPVVATDVGGIREYVAPDAGILCPGADPDALAHAALRVLDSDELHERLSAGARAAAEAHDFGRVAATMSRFYRSVAGAARRAER